LATLDFRKRAISEAIRWREHPAGMVRDLWPGTIPDAWQDEALEALPHEPRIAMKACKGPGKTALLAWVGWNILLTRPDSHGGATSISGPNLKAGLWTELARWRAKSPLLQSLFEMTSTEIYFREARETWKLEARTWAQDATPEQIGNALSGLHGPYPFWLLDETGSYPKAILPTVEAIFAGSPIEPHIVQAGNPTDVTGALYHACVTARNLWHVIEITGDPDDPKRSPRISVEHAREQIAQYGRDNPWVLINIFGQFPPGGLNTLISYEECMAATRRSYREIDIEASPRLSVGLARVPCDFALEAGEPRDQCDQVANFYFHARAQVDRFGFVVFISRENYRLRAILDEQELAAGRSGAPHLDARCARRDRVETFFDQRGDHMRLRRIE